MFGADGGLIVANDRFRDIFQLPPAALEPGQPVIEVLRNSPLAGGETNVAGTRYAGPFALVSKSDSATLTQELGDGRIIASPTNQCRAAASWTPSLMSPRRA